MKLKKIFVIIFIVTFIIGLSSYLIFHNTGKVGLSANPGLKMPIQTVPEFKVENTLELLEENNDWENDFESKFKVKLLESGRGFHGDQVEAKTGENWLGLFKQGNKFYLKNTRLKVTRVHDEIVDEENRKTGKHVSVENEKDSILLLKNANFLKEGEIKTLFGGNPNRNEVEEGVDYLSLRVGFKKEFRLGTEKFLLSVKKGINKEGEKIITLYLENNEIKQSIHSNKYFGEDDYLGALYWIGDLDKDNKPDFYFDLYFNDNVENKNLYISSKAKKGKLLKKVAVFRTTGC